jgi:hypothetical protein
MLVSGFDLSYWLKGRKQVPCPGPELLAFCGADGEPPRTAHVEIESRIELQPSLQASVHSKLREVTATSRCVLKPVGLDVTDALVGAFGTTLAKLLPDVDTRLAAAIDLRTRMEAAWTRMSEPRELRAGVWLAWNPEGVGIMPLAIDGPDLRTGVQLRLRPVVTAGSRPAVAPKPLPLAYSATPDDHFQLQLPVHLRREFVQERLERALDIDKGGMALTMGKYRVHVTSADVTGEGAQVVIDLGFGGDMSGTVQLTGTPIYDAASRTLRFPDLDYVLDSDQFLLNSADFVAHSQVRDRLRERFTVELGDNIDQLKTGLHGLLNREDEHMKLQGSVEELRLLSVSRLPNGAVFSVFLATRGHLAAQIKAPTQP